MQEACLDDAVGQQVQQNLWGGHDDRVRTKCSPPPAQWRHQRHRLLSAGGRAADFHPWHIHAAAPRPPPQSLATQLCVPRLASALTCPLQTGPAHSRQQSEPRGLPQSERAAPRPAALPAQPWAPERRPPGAGLPRPRLPPLRIWLRLLQQLCAVQLGKHKQGPGAGLVPPLRRRWRLLPPPPAVPLQCSAESAGQRQKSCRRQCPRTL